MEFFGTEYHCKENKSKDLRDGREVKESIKRIKIEDDSYVFNKTNLKKEA